MHMTSRTRPSLFSAFNIEKLGMGLGTRLPFSYERQSLDKTSDTSHSTGFIKST